METGTKGQEVSSGVSGGLLLKAAIDYSTYTQLVRTLSLVSPQKQEKMENVVFTPWRPYALLRFLFYERKQEILRDNKIIMAFSVFASERFVFLIRVSFPHSEMQSMQK